MNTAHHRARVPGRPAYLAGEGVSLSQVQAASSWHIRALRSVSHETRAACSEHEQEHGRRGMHQHTTESLLLINTRMQWMRSSMGTTDPATARPCDCQKNGGKKERRGVDARASDDRCDSSQDYMCSEMSYARMRVTPSTTSTSSGNKTVPGSTTISATEVPDESRRPLAVWITSTWP